jgi:pyruvate decarboxylase
LFDDEHFSGAPHIQLVEIVMPKMDAPRALVKIGELTAKLNSGVKTGA